MSILKSITLSGFRNLNPITLELSPHINLFFGDNGSGKTSFLESLYYLCLGKSFRAANSNKLIQNGEDSFHLFARRYDTMGMESHFGIERYYNGERNIKLNSEPQTSIAPITRLLPLQFMSPTSARFFHDGPKERRKHLDWALFHVEPSFLNNWQVLQRVLKQRNSALKHRHSTEVWDQAFVNAANTLDHQRQNLFNQIESLCLEQLTMLLPQFSFTLRYQRGWSTDKELNRLLNENHSRDLQLGYTYYGPQRADFLLTVDAIPAQDILSQGQQKLAAYALHLALGIYLQNKTGYSPLYLIDDLPSELDLSSRNKISQSLQRIEAQTFITGVSLQELHPLFGPSSACMFHVEHGAIKVHVECEQKAEEYAL